ncbi:MAG: hypothetical protein ABIO57_03735 [Candidatus Paceibacterota bacterium]
MKALPLNDFGKKVLVEDCQKVLISDFIRSAKSKLKQALLAAELQSQDLDVSLTTSPVHRNGLRYWFACPLCQKRVGVLYVHPINHNLGCRECLNLKYKKCRFKGMVEIF